MEVKECLFNGQDEALTDLAIVPAFLCKLCSDVPWSESVTPSIAVPTRVLRFVNLASPVLREFGRLNLTLHASIKMITASQSASIDSPPHTPAVHHDPARRRRGGAARAAVGPLPHRREARRPPALPARTHAPSPPCLACFNSPSSPPHRPPPIRLSPAPIPRRCLREESPSEMLPALASWPADSCDRRIERRRGADPKRVWVCSPFHSLALVASQPPGAPWTWRNLPARRTLPPSVPTPPTPPPRAPARACVRPVALASVGAGAVRRGPGRSPGRRLPPRRRQRRRESRRHDS